MQGALFADSANSAYPVLINEFIVMTEMLLGSLF
jgi:hypothetical protein